MSKILLVEDENNLREIYEARLEAEGFNIISAKDGEEALALAKAEKPDLIISDIMMPKISGFEMLDILRNTKELKNTKVIMLTALGQSDDQHRASNLGADKYLVKSQVTLEDIVKSTYDLLTTKEQTPSPTPTQAANNTAQPNPAAAPVEPAEPPAASQRAEPEATNDNPAATDQPADSGPKDDQVEPAPAPEPQPEKVEAKPEQPASSEVAPLAEPLTADDYRKEEAAQNGTTDQNSAAPIEQSPAEPENNKDGEQPASEDQPQENTDGTPPENQPTDSAAEEQSETSTNEDSVENLGIDTTSDSSTSANDAAVEDQTNTEAAVEPDATVNPQASEPQEEAAAQENVLVTPSPETDVSTLGTQSEEPNSLESASSDNVTIAHKKVIEPISSDSKTDIQTLLAEEQAKSGDISTGKPVIVDLKTRPNPPPGTTDVSGIAI